LPGTTKRRQSRKIDHDLTIWGQFIILAFKTSKTKSAKNQLPKVAKKVHTFRSLKRPLRDT